MTPTPTLTNSISATSNHSCKFFLNALVTSLSSDIISFCDSFTHLKTSMPFTDFHCDFAPPDLLHLFSPLVLPSQNPALWHLSLHKHSLKCHKPLPFHSQTLKQSQSSFLTCNPQQPATLFGLALWRKTLASKNDLQNVTLRHSIVSAL